MTYFEDETPYSFAPSQGEGVVLNVGWLDGSRTYVQGAVPSDFVGRLRDLCASGTTRTRGWHRCNVCPDGAPYPTAVERADTERYLVGDAEIRVVGQASVIYAAPTMVIHYVQDHGYRPPDDFIVAVLDAPPGLSEPIVEPGANS